MSESSAAASAAPGIRLSTRAIWLVAAVIVGLTLFVARFATVPNQGFADAAAVLAMVGLVAVGIERIIEAFWSLMSRAQSGWWPLDQIAAAVDSLVDETNAVATPAFAAAEAGLEAAKGAIGVTRDQVEALDEQIQKVRAQAKAYEAQVARISSLAKDNQRVQLLTTAAFQAVNRLDTAYGRDMPAVRQAFNDASQVTAGVSDILAGFKDNPAKKVISIALGWVIGLVVAGFAGLDLFAAAGAPVGPTDPALRDQALFPFLGVALTGFVLGLGANPTHEVIRLVTEAAKSRRLGNLPRPEVVGSPDERDERRELAAMRPSTSRAKTPEGPTITDRLHGSTAASPARVRPGVMNLRS
jgi:hypothetical protein